MRHNAWPYPELIAHRGAGKLAPENTLAAMRVGKAHGYRMVEFDAKLTRDGEAILMHDSDLRRTTSGVGPVADHDWISLSTLDAGSRHSAAFAGEPIARLEPVAHYLIANGIAANIEIKPCRGRETETGRVVAALARQLWADAAPAPVLTSFSEDALQAAAASAPTLPRGLLAEHAPGDWRARLEYLGCIALVLDHTQLDRALAEDVKAAGYHLLAYTVNDPQRVAQLLGWGVDSVITDAIERIPA